MKNIRNGLLGVSALTLIAIAALTIGTRSADPRAWAVSVQVWALNHGLVSVSTFDWGFLKLHSGAYGLTALQDLRRHGATDEIRIMAVAAIDSYEADNMCGDASCAISMKERFKLLKPVASANFCKTELLPGQSLPHDFIIDTAFLLTPCRTQSDAITLRMQDFNGDGQPEIYAEMVRFATDEAHTTGPEDESRLVQIFEHRHDRWENGPRAMIYNFDARTYPHRPFMLEPEPLQRLMVNNISFRFVATPSYSLPSEMSPPQNMDVQTAKMKAIGAYIDKVPVVFPKGGHIPTDFAKALSSGAIRFERVSGNAPQTITIGQRHFTTSVRYPYPSRCMGVTNCRAIVADLNQDGREEVILISDPSPEDEYLPLDATLLAEDGAGWRVVSNVKLCKEIVPDINRAKIEILPSKWQMIRLGSASYPTVTNPGCDNGMRLE